MNVMLGTSSKDHQARTEVIRFVLGEKQKEDGAGASRALLMIFFGVVYKYFQFYCLCNDD